MKLSIIIPVYNEEKTISHILDLIRNVKFKNNLTKEIIVIDDGSSDLTSTIIKKQKYDLRYYKHPQNLGKGAAIRTGLQKATGQIIIIQDADLEYDPQDYSKLIKPILDKKTQVVYGTRLKNYPLRLWGKEKTILPVNLIANRFLTLLTNILYNSDLTDMETGYKVFTKDVIRNIFLESNRFDIEPELTAKILKMGSRIIEIPIETHPRTYSEGKKIGFIDGLVAIWTLFKYRFYN